MRPVFQNERAQALSQQYNLTLSQLVFRFSIDIGMLPLTGTTSEDHMKEDLEVLEKATLDDADIREIESMTA